jgi:VWFA-related protein
MQKFALCLALAIVLALFALPQQPAASEEETPTLRMDVDLVNLHFNVRDKRGVLIPTLGKDDFELFEDGKPQLIKHFAQETKLPLTLGLLVDNSKSQENLIETEKRAASRFFEQVLREKDMAFLISFGSEAELLQDCTNSAELLSRALDGLRVLSQPGGLHPGPVPTAARARGTVLFDAVFLASEEKMKREVGRKALILITDGMDYGSRLSREEAISAAHKADSMVYSIYYSDPRFYPGSDSDLKKMANETGGRVFRVSRKHDLDEIFQQIQDEMRSQYTLTYTPTNAERDGTFRKIELKTKSGDYKVQARKGYFAPTAGARVE